MVKGARKPLAVLTALAEGPAWEPTGGWPEVDEKRVEAFALAMRDLADAIFGVDSDQDSAVEVEVVDRTRYERNHYALLRYLRFEDRSVEGAFRYFEGADLNRQIANEAFDRACRMLREAFKRKPEGKQG